MSVHNRLIRSVLGLPDAFVRVLETDPISIALFVLGSLLFAFLGLLAAYFVLGAMLQWVTPSATTPTWRPAR